MTVASNDHLALAPKHKCHCGEPASCLRRCRTCKTVVARCGGHMQDIARETLEHCKP